MIKLVEKWNGRNLMAYMPNGEIKEAIRIRGKIFLAKIGADFKLIPQWEFLKKKQFIFVR